MLTMRLGGLQKIWATGTPNDQRQ